jgi:hypothetical protein
MGGHPRRWPRNSVSTVSGLRLPDSDEAIPAAPVRNQDDTARRCRFQRRTPARVSGTARPVSQCSRAAGEKTIGRIQLRSVLHSKAVHRIGGNPLWTENAKSKSNQVHLILQGKGGVGKSLISAILGQYFQHKKITPHCFDTDPVNATFAQYQALQAEHINVLRRGAINDKRFDELFEKICQIEGVCIVDTGATTFVPLWNYILENEILKFLADDPAGSLSIRWLPADRP